MWYLRLFVLMGINVVVILPVRLADVFAVLAHEEFMQLEVLADDGFADGGHGLVDSG